MNKLTLALVNAVALGLIGCGDGSGGSTDVSAATATAAEGGAAIAGLATTEATASTASVSGTASAAVGGTASASAGSSTAGTAAGEAAFSTIGDVISDGTSAASTTGMLIEGVSAASTVGIDTAGSGTASASVGDTANASAGLLTPDTTAGAVAVETAGNTAGIDLTNGGAAGVETAANSIGGNNGSLSNNPGALPDPIVAEVTTIDMSTFSGPAGYKIYAGDAVDPEIPADAANFVENSYLNLEFQCNGEVGNIQVFPRDSEFDLPYGGTFSWTPVESEDEFGFIEVTLAAVTYGDESKAGFLIDIDKIVNGSLIVGTSLFEDLVVTRILQFESCN